MMPLSLLPVAAALAVLAAHFYRAAALVPLAAVIALSPLLFVRRHWAARVLQIALVVGALEWLRSLVVLVAYRQTTGQPFVRLAIILGAVALATAACAALFGTASARAHFRLPLRERA